MLDAIDSRLLAEIQANAMLTAQELGERLNLSPSQAARRRQRLEAEGFVMGYAARLSPAKVGLDGAGLRAGADGHPFPRGRAQFWHVGVNLPRDRLSLDPDRRGRLSAAGVVRRSARFEPGDPHSFCCRIQRWRGCKARL